MARHAAIMTLDRAGLITLRDACTHALQRHARSRVRCGEAPGLFRPAAPLCPEGKRYAAMDQRLREASRDLP